MHGIRFWSEVRHGLKPAKIAQKTELDPPRKIPPSSYDTNDGFYNPKTLMLVSPTGELLRVPVCQEDSWIKKYCRKGFPQAADFRPDLFENWFEPELIEGILKMQDKYRKGLVTYEELQQYYANNNLLPSTSKYQKIRTLSEIEREQFFKQIPEPKLLTSPRKTKKFQGHQIPSEVLLEFSADDPETRKMSSWYINQKKSKSLIKFTNESKPKVTPSSTGVNNFFRPNSSKISFRLSSGIVQNTDSTVSGVSRDLQTGLRKIPKAFLEHSPILRPPFSLKTRIRRYDEKRCKKKGASYISHFSELEPEDSTLSFEKSLVKFIQDLILDTIDVKLINEREKLRNRLIWARKLPQKSHMKVSKNNEKCLMVLQELFDAIPDKEEYCDSDKICDLKELAEDKHQMLQYWGKRIYLLKFEDEKDLNI